MVTLKSLLTIALVSLAAISASAEESGNIAHDALSALPAARQAEVLGKADPSGRCDGKFALFLGMSHDKLAFWSVLCKNGTSYAISLAPDQSGTAKILNCTLARALGIECFKTFDEVRREQR